MKKRTYKTIIKTACTVLIAALLSAAAVGCADVNEDSSGTVSVVAINFPSYDFVRQIGGERVDLTMLVPPGSDDHSYEPSPADLIAVGRCDLLLYTGGESDGWVEDMCASFDGEGINTLRMLDCVDLLREEITEGMETGAEDHAHDHDDGDEHDSEAADYDEHVWTSLGNSAQICERITDELARLDPDGADIFRENCKKYTGQLGALDAEFSALVGGAENNTLIFGDRFPFRYFTEDYGISYYAAFPGCASQTEPSIKTVAYLVDKVKAEGISTVFYTDLSNSATAESIAAETGAAVACLYSCHNITLAQFEAGETYLSLMRQNLEALKAAYGG